MQFWLCPCYGLGLRVYYGKGTEVDFVRFFVLNAKVLERIELVLLRDYSDEWMKNQYIQLQLQDKASCDARFQFKGFSSSHARNNKKNIHDLSIVDPFNASFLEDYAPLREGIFISYSSSKLIYIFSTHNSKFGSPLLY